MVDTSKLPPSVQKAIAEQGGGGSGGSGGGSVSGGGSSAPSPSPTPTKAVFKSDQFGNLVQVSGPPTTTISQARTRARFEAGRSFSGSPGTSAQEEFKGGSTIEQRQLNEGIVKTSITEVTRPAVPPPQSRQAIRATRPQQPTTSRFQEMANFPFGRERQRRSVSELKRLQAEESERRRISLLTAPGSITAAPKRSKLRELKSDFARGFALGGAEPETQRFTLGEQMRSGQVSPIVATAGIGVGLFSLGAGAPKALGATVKATKATLKGTRAARAALEATKAAKATAKLRATRSFQFLKNIGLGVAEAKAIPIVTRKISKATATPEQRQVIGSLGFEEAVKAGFAAEKESVRAKGFFPALAGELPFTSQFLARGEFEKATRAQFEKRGLKGQALELRVQAALRQRTAGNIGETAALLEISRRAESVGRKGVVTAFERAGAKGVKFTEKKSFGTLFKLTAPSIARAGFIEGFSQEIAQQESRRLPTNLKEAGIIGGIGALSAGAIGGTIVGTKLAKPAVSKGIELVTFFTDPFEKPGDLLQDLTEVTQKRILGRTIRTPQISKVIKEEDIITLGVRKSAKGFKRPKASAVFTFDPNPFIPITPTPTQKPPKIKDLPDLSSIGVVTPSQVQKPGKPKAPIISFATTPVSTPTEIPTLESIIGAPISPTITTPVQTPIPVDVPVDIPIVTPTQTVTNIFTPTGTPTNVPINVPISTTIPIPVFTPLIRSPPPFIPGFGLPSGFGRRRGKGAKRKAFVNELEASRAILSNLIFGGIGPISQPLPKKTKGKKKKSKTKTPKLPGLPDLKQGGQLFDNLIFGGIGPVSQPPKKKKKSKTKIPTLPGMDELNNLYLGFGGLKIR